MTHLRRLLVLITLCLPAIGLAQAQDTQPPAAPVVEAPASAAEPVVVATRVLPPFVIKEGDGYTGFSVQLWNELAQRVGVAYTWKETANVKEILAAVHDGSAQLGIAAISITSEREQNFDFSQPMFESGLQVMVPAEAESGFSPLTVLRYFTSGAMPYLMGILALLILVPGHVVWWAERRHAEPAFSRHYFPGIWQAMGWALSAAAGQQNENPRSRFGRFMSVAAIFISLLFLTYWQAELTSSFTVAQLQGGIQGPDDLPGKRVGATTGSTAAEFVKAKQAKLTEYQTVDQVVAALEKGELDAVVFDAPVLLYYASHSGAGKVRVVGAVFKKENYGIVFPQGIDAKRRTSLRKKINEALLKMREDGTYDRLYDTWFKIGSAQ